MLKHPLILLGAGLIGILDSTSASAIAPSFSCNAASTADEVAICSSNKLSELDNIAAAGFNFVRLRYGMAKARKVGSPLLKFRHACGPDQNCIIKRQVGAIRAYQKLGAPVRLPEWVANSSTGSGGNARVLPTIVGECSESRISEIGGRLEGDTNFESGTSVTFKNGGHQVSYEKVWGLIRSRAGDPVRICLISIPTDCPRGDDRGRVYKTTNLRSGDSWELPDSQHTCGGA
jgi:uncharacterized protein